MEDLKSEVERLIKNRFPDAVVELEVVPLVEKLSGEVVTGEFRGLSMRRRHTLLFSLLRENLDAAQQQQLSAILTLSPAEHAALLAYG